MALHELNTLQRRYRRDAEVFKAAWTFCQIALGLGKVFPGNPSFAELSTEGFQEPYSVLKEVPANLSEAKMSSAEKLLDEVAELVNPKIQRLKQIDVAITPELLTEFFSRIRNFESRVFNQVINFYLYADLFPGREGLEKVEVIASEILRSYPLVEANTRFKELAEDWWAILDTEDLSSSEIERIRVVVEAVEAVVMGSRTVGQFRATGASEFYRSYKSSLGERFLHPEVLCHIMEVNQRLRHHESSLLSTGRASTSPSPVLQENKEISNRLNQQKHVFISYAREDSAVAQVVFDDLLKRGFVPWLDTESLLPGQRWKAEIRKAIEGACAFVALISESSLNKRGYVQNEMKTAFDVINELPGDAIYILPIRLDDCNPAEEPLKRLQWVDLFRGRGKALELVSLALETIPGARAGR